MSISDLPKRSRLVTKATVRPSSGSATTTLPPTPACPIDRAVVPSGSTNSWVEKPSPKTAASPRSASCPVPSSPAPPPSGRRAASTVSAVSSEGRPPPSSAIAASNTAARDAAETCPFADGSRAARTFRMLKTVGLKSCSRPRYLARIFFGELLTSVSAPGFLSGTGVGASFGSAFRSTERTANRLPSISSGSPPRKRSRFRSASEKISSRNWS
mmetsp:Transcript_10563/g.21088  ORF Transcript_10563/g.21088 Transcript_10563/m.21088 type:complete len:214 (-) Transcript_10563:2343-2984(-)